MGVPDVIFHDFRWFFAVFHDFFTFFPKITKYQFLLIQPFLTSNRGKKLVLRAGLEPTTLCLEGRCCKLNFAPMFQKCYKLMPKTA